MKFRVLVAIACGVLSLFIVHFAYWLNANAGAIAPVFVCNPYLEGCVSTSRAVRSGPGLIWFKAVMLPLAVLLFLTWRSVGDWMALLSIAMPRVRKWTVRLGIGGAIALVFYVIYLGTEGPVYSWLRRYGVVFFFGFTALAQLLAARFVWALFPTRSRRVAFCFIATVFFQWAIGVFSVFKRFIFRNPEVIDRLENITEWFMVAAMSLGFVLMGLLMREQRTGPRSQARRSAGPGG